ncbi:carboxypeptidase-like regulatory domain-containing protein [Pontibacter sp. BAB1700]|uniref:carboxypeptidase-like regulatory domain-containing protein n=1 Tax=Pontibacter sp. BAB1700 TaxID=1144253 RepID=UPI00026BD124|nr:carboxypeptidase-like regulatory domain-containing protein [Pontibacter sp. BAB1700]EJF11917.1 TonB-dependent receptor [Pontibacter sp. BAB1700]
MKKSLLLALLGLSTVPALAQAPQAAPQQQAASGMAVPRGNATITGTVQDADTKKPVEFATVALINLATGKPIDGAMADDKGRFTISKVGVGKYRLQVSFLGYQQKLVEDVTVSSDNASVNVGAVAIASDAKKLSEVVITGEKPLVEEKIDRTVYNAEKDITNSGGNAADVLQKVPAFRWIQTATYSCAVALTCVYSSTISRLLLWRVAWQMLLSKSRPTRSSLWK